MWGGSAPVTTARVSLTCIGASAGGSIRMSGFLRPSPRRAPGLGRTDHGQTRFRLDTRHRPCGGAGSRQDNPSRSHVIRERRDPASGRGRRNQRRRRQSGSASAWPVDRVEHRRLRVHGRPLRRDRLSGLAGVCGRGGLCAARCGFGCGGGRSQSRSGRSIAADPEGAGGSRCPACGLRQPHRPGARRP